MLTSTAVLLNLPGVNNPAVYPVPYLEQLIPAADAAVKSFCKQDLEVQSYDEMYSGTEQRDIICRQKPVLLGQTLLDPTMAGLVLPQSTIKVLSTANFDPCTSGLPGFFEVQTGAATWTAVQYTGVTATTFTGCTGGIGTLLLNGGVYSPLVYFDMAGYAGQPPNSFSLGTGVGPSTLMVGGTQYYLRIDRGKTSKKGLIRRIGGSGQGFVGFFPENYYSGRLAAYKLPVWARGDENIRVQYAAGYLQSSIEIAELQYACSMLVIQMARIQPYGANVSSENLGAATYGVLLNYDTPELGEIRATLRRYREISL